MAESTAVDPTTNGAPRVLPERITLTAGLMPTPNEMRALKAATGRPLTELLGGDLDDLEEAPDRLQSLAWIALRREGYDLTWDEAGDVSLVMTDAEPPDPTKPASSISS